MKIDCGVYLIANTKDNTIYIGSTMVSFRGRWLEHRRLLQHNKHHNCHLQRAYSRDGELSFIFTVLERINGDSVLILKREQFWLDLYHERGMTLYNIATDAIAPMAGLKHSVETRRKLACPHPAFYNLDSGEIIPAGHNLSETCRQEGLNQSHMWFIAAGHHYSHKNWVRLDSRMACQGWVGLKPAMRRRQGKSYPAFCNRGTGEIISAGMNLGVLCRRRGLSYNQMNRVAQGINYSHRGWVLADGSRQNKQYLGKNFPALRNAQTGETIPAGQNIADLCHQRGFNFSCMCKVIKGTRKQHKGWQVAE